MEKEQLIALVKKSQSGDPDAIEKLLQYAHTSVSYQCRKMLNNEQDAEDMTQEVLVTIYTKLDTLQEPAAFWKWANQITTSRCINALNRTHVEYQFAEDEEGHSILDTLEELDEQVIPDKAIDNAETVRMIEEIVSSLPDAQRAATLMFYYSEMSVKEIAQAMQVSENTIKSRLNYARKAIKEKVLDYEKKGVKLYGLSPLPFLLYFLRLAAQNSADTEAAGVVVAEVMAAEGAAAGIAVTSTAGAGSAAAAAGGSAATATATTTATGIFAGISAKVVAGVLAAVVTVGSVVAVAIPNTQGDPTTMSTEATSAMATEFIPETELPTTETTSEAPTEAPTEAPETEPCKHDYKKTVIAPTTTAQGYTLYACKKCGHEYKSDYTDKLPSSGDNESHDETDPTVHQHDYISEVTVEPACDHPGTRTYTCQTCGHSYNEEMSTLEHDWTDWGITKEPTTESEGQEMRKCKVCGFYEHRAIDKLPSDETEPAHQHSYKSETTRTPNCTDMGRVKYTCACGFSYEEDTPALGHDWGEWYENNFGQPEHRCMTCGLVTGEAMDWEDFIGNGSDGSNGNSGDCPSCGIGNISLVLLTEPTCEFRGEAAGQCDYCGYISGYSYPPANGHNMVDGICAVCGAAETACNHVYDGGVENWPAGSMTWEPYILYTCTLCGHTYTELIDYLP